MYKGSLTIKIFMTCLITLIVGGVLLWQLPGLSSTPPFRQSLTASTQRVIVIPAVCKRDTTPKKGFLPLRLVGIIFNQAASIIAHIEDLTLFKAGEYKEGDCVGGAKLVRILEDQVIFLKDGLETVLTLDNTFSWSGPDTWIEAVGEDNFVVSKARLAKKDLAIKELLGEGTHTPYISEDGEVQGLLISTLKQDGYVNQAGIKEGDIIKSVNGHKVDSKKKPVLIYKSISSLVKKEKNPLIKVELKRNEELRTLKYRLLPN